MNAAQKKGKLEWEAQIKKKEPDVKEKREGHQGENTHNSSTT